MSDEKEVDELIPDATIAPVGNYYGSPYVRMTDAGPVMGVQSCEVPYQECRISKKFYDAWISEFDTPPLGACLQKPEKPGEPIKIDRDSMQANFNRGFVVS